MRLQSLILLLALTLLASPAHAQSSLGTAVGLPGRVLAVGPGANLFQAKQRATAGTTIVAGPGMYNSGVTNLLKNNVNWFFFPGAVISNSLSADVGIFDNTFEGNSGAITSSIAGYLTVVDASSVSSGIFRGSALTLSNPLSRVVFQCERIWNSNGDIDPGIRHFGGSLNFDVTNFDFGLGGSPLYWGEGNEDVYGTWQKMDAGSDAPLWVEGNGRGNWFLSGLLLDSARTGGGSGAIYFKPSNPAQKLWLTVQEIYGASVAAGYGGVLTCVTGKLYVTAQKISAVEDTATPRALMQIDSGECWVNVMKATVTNNQHFVAQSGGRAWLRSQHWEDAGAGSQTRPFNYLVSGGTNWLQGGRATSLWGPWAKVTGGACYIEDVTLDTFSTLQGSNVCLWITGGTNVIKNSRFVSGSLFSVSNAAAGDLRIAGTGGLMANSNITATLTVRGGTFIQDAYTDR